MIREKEDNIRYRGGEGGGAGYNKVKLFTLMLVLSLLAEDTLHLLAALASTGGDSLSLSAL